MSEYISDNPFRLLGVSSEQGIKQVQKNLSKLKAYSKVGKTVSMDFDLPHTNLSAVDRGEDSVSKSESKILLDLNKVKYALFWYQNITPYDSVALDHLKQGDIEKATEIFEKATKSGKITPKNISAFNNLSTLLLHRQLDNSKSDCFKTDSAAIKVVSEAIDKKLQIIDSEFFPVFCENIKITSDIDISLLRNATSKILLDRLVKSYSQSQLRKLISYLDEGISEVFSNELVKSPVANLKTQIKQAADKTEDNAKDGLLIGKNLIKNCVTDLKDLKAILGASHYLYEELADKISNQIMQCGIGYYNEVSDHGEFLSAYKYALSLACNDKTKSRAKDCIKHCEEDAVNKICCSCNVNKIEKYNSKTITMYKITERNTWSNQIKYQRLNIDINFCKECNEKLNGASNKNLIGKIIVTVVIALIVAAASEEPALFILGLFSYALVSPLVDGIDSSYENAIRSHRMVREAIREGFSFNEPS